MDNKNILDEEKLHLVEVQAIIDDQLEDVEDELNTKKDSIIDQKKYLWENIYELDPEEIASNRVLISEDHDMYEFTEDRKRLLLKLKDNTYFGRIDFLYEGESEPEIMYIGLGGLMEKTSIDNIIFDWRAPVSSMFYDFDKGPAYYEAPMGKIEGTLTKKRQLKVSKGNLEYALDSGVKIDDEILQRELSGNGSTKMRNIVATIQREQNAVVRNQSDNIMVVQGVAGSGKTSIALHRVAYLLYQNRKNLSSSEVLIISPNKIFAEYISNVLPELGEQNISEVSFDEVAEHELKGIARFESKYKQMEYIVNSEKLGSERLMVIRFKNSQSFIDEMKGFIKREEDSFMKFSDCKINDYVISKDQLEELYNVTFAKYPIFERIDKIAARIADLYESDKNAILSISARKEFKKHLLEMAKTTDILSIYASFIEHISGKNVILKNDRIKGRELLYEDVFPVVLMKYLIYGSIPARFGHIKHVIVDEMQDYTVAEYEILKLIFKCNMTILGDVDQVVDRSTNNIIDTLNGMFDKDIMIVKMMKTYRSTFEISEFCRKLAIVEGAVSFERHGKKPNVSECKDQSDVICKIEACMDNFCDTDMTTQVFICKTAEQAEELYSMLDDVHKDGCYLMNNPDAQFKEGIIVTNSYLVKGLEFDSVIIPNADDDNYKTEQDKQILYIACTRALHELTLFYNGQMSDFVKRALED